MRMARAMPPCFLLAVLAALLHGRASAASSAGMRLQPAEDCTVCSLEGPAVMGVDGVEYPNVCVARCQGVQLQRTMSTRPQHHQHRRSLTEGMGDSAPANAAGFRAAATNHRAAQGGVSWEDMQALAHEGYKFHGRYDAVDGAPVMPDRVRTGSLPPSLAAQGVAVTFPDNNVYVQTELASIIDNNNNDNDGCGEAVTPETDWPGQWELPMLSVDGGSTGNEQQLGQGGGRGLRGVIGKDDRFKVWGNTLLNRATIQIRYATRPGRHARCTGALITPSVVLTAGHCAYSHHKKYGIGYYKQSSFEFYERTSKAEPALRLPVKILKVVTTRGWIEDQDNAYDISLLYLNDTIGNELGWVRTGFDCQRKKYSLFVLGYPGENKELGLKFRSDCNVSLHDTCADKVMHHACDTTPGESGSPMFTADDNVIRAVHSCSITKTYNGAAMLRPAIYNLITAAWEATGAAGAAGSLAYKKVQPQSVMPEGSSSIRTASTPSSTSSSSSSSPSRPAQTDTNDARGVNVVISGDNGGSKPPTSSKPVDQQ